MTDKGFIEIAREYSPNNKKLILEYYYDVGALGFSSKQISILKENQQSDNLAKFNLPRTYRKANWIDDNRIQAEIDIIPFLREGKSVSELPFKINGVTINPKLIDIPENGELIIEARKSSPDNKKELIAYRYITRQNLNFIHVSIIDKGEELPKIGNYFIADISSDYVLNGDWISNNTIELETNSFNQDMVKYFFVKNRPPIKYKIKVDDQKYKSKYRWTNDKTVRKTF